MSEVPIKLFNAREVRAFWDAAINSWHFSVLESVGALANSRVEGEMLCVR